MLNALENGGTTSERGFALVAELMRDFILGMVARSDDNNINGDEWRQQVTMETSIAQGVNAEERPSKSLQIQITEYCHELWLTGWLQHEELFGDVPPPCAHLKHFLYSATIQIPLFRGLSRKSLMRFAALQNMYALAGDTVMEEGQPGRELHAHERRARSVQEQGICVREYPAQGELTTYLCHICQTLPL